MDARQKGSKAVIYCRVSSDRQVKEGSGLDSQAQRCRQYATSKGYAIAGVFKDEGVSGAVMERPGLQAMLDFIKTNSRGEQMPVIIDDISRIARSVQTHINLRAAILANGGLLESPSFKFDDGAMGEMVETIFAAVAQYGRTGNREQVLNRMKARLEGGYWAFRCPPGYMMSRQPAQKKIMIFDLPRSNLIREALEGFASGRFGAFIDVQRFLASHGYFGVQDRKSLSVQLNRVREMLTQVLYTGHLEYLPWGITLRKALHPALISLETYDTIQRRIGNRWALDRRGTSEQPPFELRGCVVCHVCRKLLTGSVSRGRSALYPYYHCFNRLCPEYGKTTSKSRLEADFEQWFGRYGASEDLLALGKTMTIETWRTLMGDIERRKLRHQARIDALDKNIQSLASKLSILTNETAIRAVETSIADMERERLVLVDNADGANMSELDVGTAYDRVAKVLENPYERWKYGSVNEKKFILHTAFTEPIVYERNRGFGTASLTLPYHVFARPGVTKSSLVDLGKNTWNQVLEEMLKWALP